MGNRSRRVSRAGLFLLPVTLLSLTAFLLSDGTPFVREGNGESFFFWPTAQAPLNLQLGCPPTPLEHWGPCFDDAARDAAATWSNAGSQFRFTSQSINPSANPCAHADGVNTVAFRPTLCGRPFGDALAVTFLVIDSATGAFLDTDVLFDAGRTWSTYPGPLQRNALGLVTVYDFHRVAIHEFGHVLGLDHPDDFGQSVVAIMNSRVSDLDALQLDDISGIQAAYPTSAPLVGALENPQSGGFVSGIGLISGWVCTASRVDLQIDGTLVQAAYGTTRADTRQVCGDENNGFGFLINWNNLGDGPHTVTALANGIEFGRATVTVTTLGQEFLTGASGTYTLPFNGRNVTVEWKEELQNFVIVGVE
ncbi:MAG: matrixin family metalloprotease [Thermodesulfobacteriota bacterium]|jgi:hypothetical protein